MALMTRKQWQDYKKKHKIPDGIGGKVSLGPILDKYEKSKMTPTDVATAKKSMSDWVKHAEKADKGAHKKHAKYVYSLVEAEEAEAESRQKDEARAAGEEAARKRNAKLATTLAKHHANLAKMYKGMQDKRDVYEARRGDPLYAEQEKIFKIIRKEVEAVREVGIGHMHLHDAVARSSDLTSPMDPYDEYMATFDRFLTDFLAGAKEVAKDAK